MPHRDIRCGKPLWNCDLQIPHLGPFYLAFLINFKNMMQPIRLHHTDYTKQTPNVKLSRTDLSPARQKAVGLDSIDLRKKERRSEESREVKSH